MDLGISNLDQSQENQKRRTSGEKDRQMGGEWGEKRSFCLGESLLLPGLRWID